MSAHSLFQRATVLSIDTANGHGFRIARTSYRLF